MDKPTQPVSARNHPAYHVTLITALPVSILPSAPAVSQGTTLLVLAGASCAQSPIARLAFKMTSAVYVRVVIHLHTAKNV